MRSGGFGSLHGAGENAEIFSAFFSWEYLLKE